MTEMASPGWHICAPCNKDVHPSCPQTGCDCFRLAPAIHQRFGFWRRDFGKVFSALRLSLRSFRLRRKADPFYFEEHL